MQLLVYKEVLEHFVGQGPEGESNEDAAKRLFASFAQYRERTRTDKAFEANASRYKCERDIPFTYKRSRSRLRSKFGSRHATFRITG